MDFKLKSAALAWLLMAAFCGLIGFFLVYHYATFERPLKNFAIVVDAGSTQTRSGLFSIAVDTHELIKWTNADDDDDESSMNDNNTGDDHRHATGQSRRRPLSQILQVRQVSGCVNGGPLATLKTEDKARELVRKCLGKFVGHIKKLDFVEVTRGGGSGASSGQPTVDSDIDLVNDNVPGYDDLDGLDSEEVSKQLAMMNHRVNSVTRLYLGATAGMRSLNKINPVLAGEKLQWIDRALKESNSLLPSGSPFINKGFVGIIRGSDEAAFGWLSVNFVCDNLYPYPADHQHVLAAAEPAAASFQPPLPAYHIGSEQEALASTNKFGHLNLNDASIGTLELGGASAQMAFQAPKSMNNKQLKLIGFIERKIELFNANYRLATRSDLCLGMSQAVLRANYVLLRDYYQASLSSNNLSNLFPTDIENPCLQNGAKLNFSSKQLEQIWQGSCLSPSPMDYSSDEFISSFTTTTTNKTLVTVRGSGNVKECARLLDTLIEPKNCKKYFLLCPINKNKQTPPSDIPFVTMSGYNHALNVLDLNLSRPSPSSPSSSFNANGSTVANKHLVQVIADKLGGSSIDYLEFVEKTRVFCSTPLGDLSLTYPKISKPYESIICLQLVYIRKLLTQFYLFDPATNWPQIKFLLSDPSREALPTVAGKKLDVRRDIGWTLGLLLNATSHRLSGDELGNEAEIGTIYFHHGATVLFVMRTTILIMVACCFLAICSLIVAIVGVRRAQRGGAYLNHP